MGANLNTIYVVDVEATCWESDPDLNDGEEQNDQPNEVIEIGVAALDMRTRGVFQRASIVVKPRYTKVSKFCTRLTGWTQEDVDKGLDIVDALSQFREQFKGTKNHVWCSYGEYDRHKLSSMTGTPGLHHLYGILAKDNPFDQMRAHYNIKTLMALKHNLKRELGMAKALQFYGLPLEGKHHNGMDDACNIAKITSKVLS